jgi:hypothetical protein
MICFERTRQRHERSGYLEKPFSKPGEDHVAMARSGSLASSMVIEI